MRERLLSYPRQLVALTSPPPQRLRRRRSLPLPSSEARCRSERAAGLGFPRSTVKGARATPQNCQIPQRRRYIIHFNGLSRHHFLRSFNLLSIFLQNSFIFCKAHYVDPSHQIDLWLLFFSPRSCRPGVTYVIRGRRSGCVSALWCL